MVKPGKKGDKDDEEDPIARSLQERINLGSVTQVVSKVAGSKPVAVAQPGIKKQVPKSKDSTQIVNDGEVPTPKGSSVPPKNILKDAKDDKPKPNLIKQQSQVGSKKGGKDDDSDDPIA